MARQAWNRGIEPNSVVLEHARALLLALAVLIDRAAVLPAAKRLWFLAVMASGEAEARRLIVAMAADLSPGTPAGATAAPRPAADPCPFTPAHAAGDASLLAVRFRMLALMVDALLAQVGAELPCRRAAPALLIGRSRRLTGQFPPSPARRATSPPLNGIEEPRCRRRRSSCERCKSAPAAGRAQL